MSSAPVVLQASITESGLIIHCTGTSPVVCSPPWNPAQGNLHLEYLSTRLCWDPRERGATSFRRYILSLDVGLGGSELGGSVCSQASSPGSKRGWGARSQLQPRASPACWWDPMERTALLEVAELHIQEENGRAAHVLRRNIWAAVSISHAFT